MAESSEGYQEIPKHVVVEKLPGFDYRNPKDWMRWLSNTALGRLVKGPDVRETELHSAIFHARELVVDYFHNGLDFDPQKVVLHEPSVFKADDYDPGTIALFKRLVSVQGVPEIKGRLEEKLKELSNDLDPYAEEYTEEEGIGVIMNLPRQKKNVFIGFSHMTSPPVVQSADRPRSIQTVEEVMREDHLTPLVLDEVAVGSTRIQEYKLPGTFIDTWEEFKEFTLLPKASHSQQGSL